jgi:integrase
MLKRDPYEHDRRWKEWKEQNKDGIKGISKHNSDLILEFLFDMELGKNVSPHTAKGERSCIRLNGLHSKMVFFAEKLQKDLDKMTQDEIHSFFHKMREGEISRVDGKTFMSVGDFVRDFKAFWGWLRRTKKVSEDIISDLRRSDGRKPSWVYLSEEQFKTLANQAKSDYRALLWLMYDTGMRVTEAYSIRISDFSGDFTRLTIRDEYSKTFGRTISLKICCSVVKQLVKDHNLGPEDFIFVKKPTAFNKYLKSLAGKLFGDSQSLARKPYNKMKLYDIRHNASCYWLKRYPTRQGLMYRMGWSREKMVIYYSEFLGLSDQIEDDDMVTKEEKTRYEKRIEILERDRQNVNELIKELIKKVVEMQERIKSNS